MLTINMNGDANLKWGLLLGIAWTSKLNTRNQKIKHRGQYSKTLSSIYKWWIMRLYTREQNETRNSGIITNKLFMHLSEDTWF